MTTSCNIVELGFMPSQMALGLGLASLCFRQRCGNQIWADPALAQWFNFVLTDRRLQAAPTTRQTTVVPLGADPVTEIEIPDEATVSRRPANVPRRRASPNARLIIGEATALCCAKMSTTSLWKDANNARAPRLRRRVHNSGP